MTRKGLSGTGNKIRAFAVGVALVVCVAACESSATAPQTSTVRILLTDAPADMLESAEVWISHVYLQGGDGEEPDTAEVEGDDDEEGSAEGRVDLFNDPANPLVFDLLTLRDGLTADLTGLIEVDVGLYQSLRFVVDSARVTLAEGITFEDGSSTGVLKVPGGSKSGIKVKLDDVLRAAEGEVTTVTVDFDVDANFVIQTDPKTGLVKKVLFKPVLKEKHREKGHS